jgi:F-type H+-transporting ATPase subunit gamma
MANLKDIQRQIKSVKNTQKTTRAMKLVSTAKLKRAEEVAKRSRVYAQKITSVLSEIAYKVKQFKIGGIESKFFHQINDPKKVDIVFITADKGLCGGFNVQTIKTIKRLMAEYKEKKVKVRLRAIGKKGIEYFKFNDIELLDVAYNLSSAPSYEKAGEFIDKAVDDFLNGVTDKIILVHNGYKNMITQEIKIVDLLPIDIDNCQQVDCTVHLSNSLMEIEPDEEDEAVLEQLVNKYIEFNIYFSLIDSLAAEHSARMQAMDSATNNAKELVNTLTIKYNKARQEAITTELVEIISGMEAMK